MTEKLTGEGLSIPEAEKPETEKPPEVIQPAPVENKETPAVQPDYEKRAQAMLRQADEGAFKKLVVAPDSMKETLRQYNIPDQDIETKSAEELTRILKSRMGEKTVAQKAEAAKNPPAAEPKPEPLKTAVEIVTGEKPAEKPAEAKPEVKTEKPTDKEKEKKLEKSPEMAEVKKEIKDPLSAAIQRFTDRYNIKPEDLTKIPGFNELTGGQKAIVLENFNQISYGKIREGAYARVEKDMKATGFWGKTKRSLLKAETYSKAEAAEAKELFKGGIETHGDELKELIRQTKESGLDASFDKNGKLEMLFAGRTEGLTGREKEVADRFNAAAAKFAGIGNEGRFSRSEKRTFDKAKKEYDESFKELLTTKKAKLGSDEKAALEMIDIDKSVRMSQLLSSNKDVEDALSQAELKTFWQKAWYGTAKERLSYFGVGFVARSVTISALGLVSAPLVAAGLGGYSARKRAIESLKEESLRAKGGEKLRTTKKIKTERGEEKVDLLNVVDGIRLANRIENLIEKIDAATTEEAKGKLRQELNNRLFYTQAKMESGLINFGADKDRLANEYALIAAQGRAEAETGLLNKDVHTAVTERLNQFLEFKEGRINAHVRNATIKGAAMAAGFATAGYLVRDLIAGIHGAVQPTAGGNQMVADHTAATTGHVNPMPHEVAQHSAEAIPRGEVIPVPVPEVHEISATVGEHGNIWEAAHRLGLSEKEFTKLWENPNSAYNGHHLSDMRLVHPGDKIIAVYNDAAKGPHLELIPGGHSTPGTENDFYHLVTEKKFGPNAIPSKVEPAPLSSSHHMENAIRGGKLNTLGGHALTAPEHLGPLADHPAVPGGEQLHQEFGPGATGHENVAGYPDHYPPQIPTHPDHPPGNPIWENTPTHAAEHAPIVPEHPSLPHEVTGAVETHPGSLADTMVARGYTGAEYMSHDYRNDVLSYALAHHLNMQVEMDKFQMFGQKLSGNIKLYEQIHANPSKLKEASALLQSIKESIGQAEKTYGSGLFDKTKLPDFLK